MRAKYLILASALMLALSACDGGGGGSDDGSAPIDPSLQAYYKFDESGAIAFNSAQNLFHGDIIGVQRAPGKVNTALLFGENRPSFVDIDMGINTPEKLAFPDNKITLEAWYKFERLEADREYFVCGGKSSGIHPFDLEVHNGQFVFNVFSNNSTTPVELIRSNFQFENDIWYHVAVVYDGEIARLYIDGEENAATVLIHPIGDVVYKLFIGGTRDSSGYMPSFPGAIDEIKISSAAKSQFEILEYLDGINFQSN